MIFITFYIHLWIYLIFSDFFVCFRRYLWKRVYQRAFLLLWEWVVYFIFSFRFHNCIEFFFFFFQMSYWLYICSNFVLLFAICFCVPFIFRIIHSFFMNELPYKWKVACVLIYLACMNLEILNTNLKIQIFGKIFWLILNFFIIWQIFKNVKIFVSDELSSKLLNKTSWRDGRRHFEKKLEEHQGCVSGVKVCNNC